MELEQKNRTRFARMIAAGRLDGVLGPEVRDFARSEGILPLLEWMSGAATPLLRAHAALQLARSARLSRVLELLAAEGVTPIVFKGAHLACVFYPDAALRPHVDTDLLIHPRDIEATRRVFEQSGHRLLPHVSGRFVMSQFHYVDGNAHAYDVHWQVANPVAFRDLLPFEAVRAQAVPLKPYGPHALAPSVSHALVIACIHRAAHHGCSDRLIWLNDLRLMLLAASVAQIDEFCRIADAGGLNAVCHDACSRALDLFGDVPVPPDLRRRAAMSSEPTGAYLDRPSPPVQLWLDLHALPTWRNRAALLREHFFPPPAYMRCASESRAPLPWHYAVRIARGAATWLRLCRG